MSLEHVMVHNTIEIISNRLLLGLGVPFNQILGHVEVADREGHQIFNLIQVAGFKVEPLEMQDEDVRQDGDLGRNYSGCRLIAVVAVEAFDLFFLLIEVQALREGYAGYYLLLLLLKLNVGVVFTGFRVLVKVLLLRGSHSSSRTVISLRFALVTLTRFLLPR